MFPYGASSVDVAGGLENKEKHAETGTALWGGESCSIHSATFENVALVGVKFHLIFLHSFTRGLICSTPVPPIQPLKCLSRLRRFEYLCQRPWGVLCIRTHRNTRSQPSTTAF